jgi:transcriptional regulator with XRE-family HTH domain
MTKISKNIKRLRNAQSISQEALAEKLFISRQAVSSWENDRTQPDIEMIGKLAEVFNVSIEELIYGEKRKLELENEEPKQNNKLLIIIFSILGSLFVAIGIIFFIFFGWESFGIGIKTFLGLLPMLAGQIVAIYTYMKKRHSIAFCESGALVWSVGVTATLLLVNGILGIDIELFILLALSAILILPSVYIFNSVSTLVGFFGLVLTATANGINDLLTIFFLVISMIVGVFFTKHSKGKVEDFRHNFSVWISTIAVMISVIELTIGICSDLYIVSVFSIFFAMFTTLFSLSKERTFQKPFYLFGTFGLLFMLTYLAFVYDFDDIDFLFSYTDNTRETTVSFLLSFLFNAVVIALGYYFNRNSFAKNPLKIAILMIGSTSAFVALICCDAFAPIAIILTIALAICYIIIGSKLNKFYELNIGLIAIIVLMFKVIISFIDNLLGIGFTFLLSGIILFTVNFLLLRKAKKDKENNMALANTSEITDGGDLNV